MQTTSMGDRGDVPDRTEEYGRISATGAHIERTFALKYLKIHKPAKSVYKIIICHIDPHGALIAPTNTHYISLRDIFTCQF